MTEVPMNQVPMTQVPMTPVPNLHDLATMTAAQRARLLQRTETDLSGYEDKVRQIIDAVRAEGDEALARFARDFDKAPVQANEIAATEADFDAAEKALAPDVREAMEYAAVSIRKFHEDQKPDDMWLHEIRPGAFAGDRITAIPSAACYVPRGKGAFPSVALMTSIPAKVAGVKQVIMITPPGPNGKIDDATLVAARMAGVDKVFKAGGAQGVAAVAYGTQTVPKVAKIIGPGSPWVGAAKRMVAHLIDTGTPAGLEPPCGGRGAGGDPGILEENGGAACVVFLRRAERADWRNCAGPRRGGRHRVRERICAGASRSAVKRAVPVSRAAGACGGNSARRTYADDARQFRDRAEPCAADRRVGADGLAGIGVRFHEADDDRACDEQGLSRTRKACAGARDL
jgi:hypothetical protein